MSHFLVTGGCGFIGSHLVDALLARGDRVRVLDDMSNGLADNISTDVDLMIGSVTDPVMVARALRGVDGCFHLAAIPSVVRANENWLSTHQVNLSGTVTVLEQATRHGRIPVVYASSAAVYGDCRTMPIAETETPRPLSAYGADKHGCELHARIAGLAHALPTIGLRFFNVYGPRQDASSVYSGVISIFLDRARTREPLTIFGDGEQQRDFVHCSDIVTALCRAMARCDVSAPVINVCSGRATSLNGLVATISKIFGRPLEVRYAAPRIGEIRVSIGDPTRGRALLGLGAPLDIEAGLKMMLEVQPSVPRYPRLVSRYG